MKKYIMIVASVILLYMCWNYAYYHLGIYIHIGKDKEVSTFMKADSDSIYMYDENAGTYMPFEIKGVDMGSGEPGEWSTDFQIDKDTYKRWFAQIQELGANTIRIYTIQAEDFYNAYYEYNSQREAEGMEPLWICDTWKAEDPVGADCERRFRSLFARYLQMGDRIYSGCRVGGCDCRLHRPQI